MNEVNIFNKVINCLSLDLKILLSKIPKDYKKEIEEIRLRNHKPLSIYLKGRDYFLSKEGKILKNYKGAYIVGKKEINHTFQIITNHSLYAFSEEIKRGFITISGGHRVGIAGEIIYNHKEIENIKNISSLNIRIAREKKGISNWIIPYLLNNKSFYNTMIISPPQCGKTTLLRDIIRNLSNGGRSYQGFKISLVDERSEIAGMYNGVAQKDIGIRTDILDGCLKAHGIIMLIRSMSPDIIALDEIGSLEDIQAISEGVRAGIRFITTIHGDGLEDIKARENVENLIKNKIFKRFIVLDRSRGVGTIRQIIDGDSFENILSKADIQ